MRQYVIDHPAPATERLDRWSDVEDMIKCMQELGWRMEKVTQVDESGEPLRVVLRFAYENQSALPGIL